MKMLPSLHPHQLLVMLALTLSQRRMVDDYYFWGRRIHSIERSQQRYSLLGEYLCG